MSDSIITAEQQEKSAPNFFETEKIMDCTEIKIKVPSEKLDEASAIALMAVPYGIYIEDYRNIENDINEVIHADFIDEELLKADRNFGYIHIYANSKDNPGEIIFFLKDRFKSCDIECDIATDNCRDEDWQNNWKKYFKPLSVGEKIYICPSWDIPDEIPKNRKLLKIDPGPAFGTGSHETTKLCIKALENAITGGETVLDIGCGSGILSIASVILGASKAVGVDIDASAVKNANENAEGNGINSSHVEFLCGDLTDKVTGKYDIIVANIVADVIIKLSKNIKTYMNESAVFITSGIIDERENDVLSAFNANALSVTDTYSDGIWRCFVIKAR